MKKLNVKHIIITIIIMVVMIGIIWMFWPKKSLQLNGKSEEVVVLNSTYQDAGVNISNAKREGQVDTSKVGTYKITYKYENQEVTRIVTVEDNRRIIMNLNGTRETYVKKGEGYIESGCHAIDKKDGDLTSSVKISGTVDTSITGDYQIVYTVSNKDGLTINQTRNVHVIDNMKINKKGIPVLMYHYVYTDNDIPKKMNVNYIKDTDFEKQLQYLTQNKYYFPSYEELAAYAKGKLSLPEKSVILTFDGGQKGFLKYGIPLLEKYKVPATSFIIASKDGDKKVKEYASEYVSFQSHSYDMHHAGGNIGHGGIISAMKKDEIIDDLKKSQVIVQNNQAFAYPYGDVSKDAKEAVKDTNILCAFTTQHGRIKIGTDLTYAPRIRVSGSNTLNAYIAAIE